MKNKPIAAIYGRVSLEDQAKNFSLPSQLRAMEAHAAMKGYATSKEFTFIEDGPGGELDRIGLTQLRAAVRSGLAQGVVVYDLDRLARSLAHQLLLMDEFERAGARLELVTTPNDGTPESKMLLHMKGVFAEYEKAKIRERASRGRREKAQQGFRNGGRAPYGYRYLGRLQGSRGELVIIPEEAEVVRRIFRWAEESMKPLDIARRLKADGVRPRLARQWCKSVIVKILRNRIYIGEDHYNRRQAAEPAKRRKPARPGRSRKTSYKLRPESEWIRTPAPAIIDYVQFERVREQMERSRPLRIGRPSAYPLRGVEKKCGKCGFSLHVLPNRGKPRLRCDNIDRLTYRRLCDQKPVSAEKVEKIAWDTVQEIFTDPARLKRAWAEHQRRLGAGQQDLANERTSLECSIEQLKRREFRATQGMLDSELPDSYQNFRDELKATQGKRREMERRLAALAPPTTTPGSIRFDDFVSQVKMAGKASSPEERRKVYESLISRVTLQDGEMEIYFGVAALKSGSASPEGSDTNRIHRFGDDGGRPASGGAQRRDRRPAAVRQLMALPVIENCRSGWRGKPLPTR